jgi:uracil-DNA glycosylase
MNSEKLKYLTALGIPVWQLNSPPLTKITGEKESVSLPSSTLSWDDLQKAVAHCTACDLHCTRTQTVFGVGNTQAELMVIGEAPGFYEDQKGEPFVGRAGQLLNAMLKSIALERGTVYIANILKCRPPNNRDPQPDEVEKCTPFLDQQIALIKPKLLLAVGRIAAHYLLKNKQALSSLRGKIYHYGIEQTPLIVTYHPAYLLRNPADKGNAYKDLCLVRETLGK